MKLFKHRTIEGRIAKQKVKQLKRDTKMWDHIEAKLICNGELSASTVRKLKKVYFKRDHRHREHIYRATFYAGECFIPSDWGEQEIPLPGISKELTK